MGGFLTNRELVEIRQMAGLSLPDLATRQVRTTTPDGQGGVTETWASTTNIPCKLAALVSHTNAGLGGQYTQHSQWVVSLYWDQPCNPGDRIVVNGDTFEVEAVNDTQTYRLLRRAYLKRVD